MTLKRDSLRHLKTWPQKKQMHGLCLIWRMTHTQESHQLYSIRTFFGSYVAAKFGFTFQSWYLSQKSQFL
ncbi:hypothetical protein YC2023_019351 [Brassica napus]